MSMKASNFSSSGRAEASTGVYPEMEKDIDEALRRAGSVRVNLLEFVLPSEPL